MNDVRAASQCTPSQEAELSAPANCNQQPPSVAVKLSSGRMAAAGQQAALSRTRWEGEVKPLTWMATPANSWLRCRLAA